MNSLNHRLIYRFTPYLDHNLHEAWKQHEEVLMQLEILWHPKYHSNWLDFWGS